jgi:hypothetical protein
MPAALRLKNDLDVLQVCLRPFPARAPDSGISQAQLAIHGPPHRLATKIGEKPGLAF